MTACVVNIRELFHKPDHYLFQRSNYFGSLTQASTTNLGIGEDGRDVYIPFKSLLPMVNPNDIEFDGT